MIDFNKVRKYFQYEDTLSIVVSRATGILIAVYVLLCGMMVAQILCHVLFGINDFDLVFILLLLIPGILTGAGILKLEIALINLLTRGTELENYSYLRLVLFVSIIFYLLLLAFYSLFMISENIVRKILPL